MTFVRIKHGSFICVCGSANSSKAQAIACLNSHASQILQKQFIKDALGI